MEVNELLKDIRKKYEDDTLVFTLDDFYPSGEKPESIPTGCFDIDYKSGIGGIARGRVTEIFGADGAGKTVLCTSITAQAQKANLRCVYIDTEQAFDPDFAVKMGVEPEKIIFSQPETLEKALGVAEEAIRSEIVDLLIFDSLVGVGSTSEFEEKDFGKVGYGGGAKLNTLWFRRNLPYINQNKVAVIFTNQVRDVIGSFIPMLSTPGGHAMKHASSVRIQISKSKEIKVGTGDDAEIVGVQCKAVFKKNRVAPPFKTAEFEIYFDKGIWRASDILTSSIKYGIIEQAKSYFRYQGETIEQGRQKTIETLESDSALLEKVYNDLRGVING